MFEFSIVTGDIIHEYIRGNRKKIIEIIKNAYVDYHYGKSLSPKSYFLRFPNKKNSRIIALPSCLSEDSNVAGIKWIASFPDNLKESIPRASGVLVINDYKTGYPLACMEASLISAARTAASASLAASILLKSHQVSNIGFIGCGIISRNILDFLFANNITTDCLSFFDLKESYANKLAKYAEKHFRTRTIIEKDLTGIINRSDLLIFATNALAPHVEKPLNFHPGQVILNISLRDISPELILESGNVTDDTEHCLQANTSLHLAEKIQASRDFISGTIAEYILKEKDTDAEKPLVFSPFGLGVLDLALGNYLFKIAKKSKKTIEVDNFFFERVR